MDWSGRGACRALLCSLVLLLAAVGGSAATTGPINHGDTPSIVESDAGRQFQQTTQTRNNSTQHKHPDRVAENGDLGAVQNLLGTQLVGRLSNSSVRLNQAQYEQAQSILGDQYSETYEKYVDVAGETGRDENTESFEEAQENQREFISTVNEFREIQSEYQDARQAGNEQRARRLARELSTIASEANATSRRLTANYRTIGNTTGQDVTDEVQTIESISQNLTEQQATILAQEFIETKLVLQSDGLNGSFREPLQLTGRLQTTNGEALTNREVQFQIGEQVITAETDSEGQFSATYRPVQLPADTSTLTVEFIPTSSSIYLGTSANAAVNITQVTAQVSNETVPATLAFNDRLRVHGTVVVGNRSVSNVPLQLSIGGQPLETIRTNQAGDVAFTGRLPAAVPAGTQPVRLTSPLSGRAVQVAATTTQVRVQSTATTLTLTATQTGVQTLAVRGRLQTVAGTPVAGQSIQIQRAGEFVTTVQTNMDGQYTATVALPQSVQPGDTVALSAQYADPGTNLVGAKANSSITISQLSGAAVDGQQAEGTGESSGQLTFLNRLWSNRLFLLGAVAIVSLIASLRFYNRGDDEELASVEAPEPVVEKIEESSPEQETQSEFTEAEAYLEDGQTDLAVETAYRQLRDVLGANLEIEEGLTHWEFYQACADTADIDESAIRTATEAYEQAAYGPMAVSVTDAEEMLDVTSRVLTALSEQA